MSKKWFDTGYLKAKPAEVDHDKGIVRGVKVCSVGEAKGHGVHLDAEFIGTLVEQGSGAKQGLKARFGHPNMCSSALGTFIGRFKNFSQGTTVRDDGSKVECCFADLFLSNSAKETPNGDLYSYILSMAENEADMFGTSIVFTPGTNYRRNEKGEKVFRYTEKGDFNEEWRECGTPDYVECEKLHACDCVDEPAANDGLFSAFAQESVAGQITEFLDLHPQVFEALEDNPEVMKAIAQHGDKFDEFLSRYTEYRANNPEEKMSKEKQDEQLEEKPSAEVDTPAEEALEQEPEKEIPAEETPAEEFEQPAEEPPAAEPAEAPEAALSEAEPSTGIDPEAIAKWNAEFGAEIVVEALAAGGGYEKCKELHYAALAKENEQLKADNADLKKTAEEAGLNEGAEPATFSEDKGKKVGMLDVIKAGRK